GGSCTPGEIGRNRSQPTGALGRDAVTHRPALLCRENPKTRIPAERQPLDMADPTSFCSSGQRGLDSQVGERAASYERFVRNTRRNQKQGPPRDCVSVA